MGKQKRLAKGQGLQLRINLPTADHMKFITDAYGLTCHYRTQQNQPHVRFEQFLTNFLVEGSKQIFSFHLQQQEAAKKAAEEAATAGTETEEESSEEESGADE